MQVKIINNLFLLKKCLGDYLLQLYEVQFFFKIKSLVAKGNLFL